MLIKFRFFKKATQFETIQGNNLPLHRGTFCQFPFRWIYYCHSSKSTGKETGKKASLCTGFFQIFVAFSECSNFTKAVQVFVIASGNFINQVFVMEIYKCRDRSKGVLAFKFPISILKQSQVQHRCQKI